MSPVNLYIISYVVITLAGRLISMNKRQAGELSLQLKDILDDPTAMALGVVSVAAFALPVIEVVIRGSIKSNFISSLNGLLLLCLGWILSYYANRDIAENWSPSIGKNDDQLLITKGAYQIVRHPLYLSGLLIFFGTQIFFQNTWSWFLVLLLLPAIIYRILGEEQELILMFGQEYLQYQKETKALIPWVW